MNAFENDNQGCEPFAEMLSAYFDQQLGPDEIRAVEDHLARCPECQRRLEDYRALSNAVSAGKVEPRQDFAEMIMADLERRQLLGGLDELASPPTPKTIKFLRGLAAAAMITLIVSTGFLVYNFALPKLHYAQIKGNETQLSRAGRDQIDSNDEGRYSSRRNGRPVRDHKTPEGITKDNYDEPAAAGDGTPTVESALNPEPAPRGDALPSFNLRIRETEQRDRGTNEDQLSGLATRKLYDIPGPTPDESNRSFDRDSIVARLPEDKSPESETSAAATTTQRSEDTTVITAALPKASEPSAMFKSDYQASKAAPLNDEISEELSEASRRESTERNIVLGLTGSAGATSWADSAPVMMSQKGIASVGPGSTTQPVDQTAPKFTLMVADASSWMYVRDQLGALLHTLDIKPIAEIKDGEGETELDWQYYEDPVALRKPSAPRQKQLVQIPPEKHAAFVEGFRQIAAEQEILGTATEVVIPEAARKGEIVGNVAGQAPGADIPAESGDRAWASGRPAAEPFVVVNEPAEETTVVIELGVRAAEPAPTTAPASQPTTAPAPQLPTAT